MRRFLSLLLALLAAPCAFAQDLRTVSLFRAGIASDLVGYANFSLFDLDGDNVAEIVSCSDGAPLAVSRVGNGWATTWMGPVSGCRAVTVGDRDGDSGGEVIIVTSDTPAKVRIFDPRSWSPSKTGVTLPGNGMASDIAFGNVDDDAGNEIVVLTASNAYVYNAGSLALEWTAAGYGGTDLKLGDVDGDGRQDIIISGSNGWVLDAETQALKFGYLGGFGPKLAVADIDNDSKAEIVFSQMWSSQISILQGDTMQVSSFTGTTSPAVDSITIGDANADGALEIITGNNQWGDIEGRRPSDGLLLWNIGNPEHGVQGIAAGDVTGDGKAEVIWGAGFSSSGADLLFVGDAITETIKWRGVDLDGPFASAVGDLDGDGTMEYVVGSWGSESGYSGGILEVFDLATGASEGTLPRGTNPRISSVAIGQADADPAKEIIAFGENTSFQVWDGVTRQLDFTSSAPLGDRAFLVANVDGDAVDEIISGGTSSQVLVVNGGSNVIQASFVVGGYISDLALADLNADGVLDLVIGTSTNLYVYKTSNWSLEGQVALTDVGRVAAISASGGTVAAFTYGGTLRTYHGVTLTPGWTCTSASFSNISSLAFGEIADETHLLAGDHFGNIHRMTPAGTSCPSFTTTSIGAAPIRKLSFVEATGDEREDLLIDTWNTSEINLIGLASEIRGDVDGDDIISEADIDALSDYAFGAQPGLSTSGDANDDGWIGVEDIFQLIHHEFGDGPAPAP